MHTGVERKDQVKVLHMTISFERGGRRDAIWTLARYGDPAGFESSLATLRGTDSDLEAFRADFSSSQILNLQGLPRPKEIVALRDFCTTLGINVVHTHDAASQFVAAALRTVAPSLRCVMTFHRSLGFESASWRDKLRNGASLRLIDRVLTASRERRDHFISENWISPRKVQVIPLGVDQNRFAPNSEARSRLRDQLGLSEDTLLLVAAGHYGKEKGIDLALEAVEVAARLPSTPKLHFAIMGTGTPSQVTEIRTMATKLLGDRVTLLGQRPDPERWFAAADLLVHTPRIEAFGLVLIQAMASGLAVMATGVGGIPEIVLDGQTGVLGEADQIQELGVELGLLLQDPERLRQLSKAALARARAEYDAKIFAARHAELYRELLAR